MSRWIKRRMAVLGTTLLTCCLLSLDAFAHARLVKSIPADDAELSAAPGAVVLTFNESPEHSFSSVDLRNPAGEIVTTPAVREGETPDSLVMPLPENLPAGAYTVQYRVLSVDGHVVEGRFGFRIGATPAP
jgi:methionine-rich copper-binding protein CopC